MSPSVSIVIVNYNGAAYIHSSIDSALAQRYDGKIEVVVLDNRSTDDSLAVLRAVPSIRLIENDTNSGFGGGVNRAVSECASDYIALLNPDAIADPEWVAQVVSWMHKRRVELASSVVRTGEGVWFAGGSFIVPLGLAFTRRRLARAADWVSGCAMIVRRSAFIALGGFDEAFFLYCEDADFCLRAKAAGNRPAVFPVPLVDHPSDGRSTNQLGFAKATIMYASRGRLIAKHVPALWQPGALAFTALLSPLLYGVGFSRLFSVVRAVMRGFNAGSSPSSSRPAPGRA